MVKMNQFLFKPINPSIVSIYRIIFGCFMCYQMIVYYNLDYTYQFMAGPEILFSYRGLEFMQPLPILSLKIIHFLLLVSSLLVILGIWYRYAIVFFFIGFTYFSFIDITLYNNHIYLFSLISFKSIKIRLTDSLIGNTFGYNISNLVVSSKLFDRPLNNI